MIIYTEFDEAYPFYGRFAIVKDKGFYGVIDLRCDEMSSASFHDGLTRIERDDKYGFINKEGKEVIPCKYEHASKFTDGYALVGNAHLENSPSGTNIVTLYAVINTSGNFVLPMKYRVMNDDEPLPDWLLYVYNDPDYAYVTLDGVDYSDAYKSTLRVMPAPEPPPVTDYPLYLAGDFINFELIDWVGDRYWASGEYSNETFRIEDHGGGQITLYLNIPSHKDGIVSDANLYTFTTNWDFVVIWGAIPSDEFVNKKTDKEGFILTNISIFTPEVNV